MFHERLWFGLTHWTWVRIAYLALIVAGAIGFWESHQNANKIRAEVIERQVHDCVLIANNRAVILDVLQKAVALDGTITADERDLIQSTEDRLYMDSCTVTR